MSRVSRDRLQDILERLPSLIQRVRVLEPLEQEKPIDEKKEPPAILVTIPECYELTLDHEMPVLRFSPEALQMETPVLPLTNPEAYNHDLFTHMIYLVGLLEREAVMKLMEDDTKRTVGKSFGQRVRSAHLQVTRRNVRDLIASPQSGLSERNIIRLNLARQRTPPLKTQVVALRNMGDQYRNVVHVTGRYLFVGYVTVDANLLRKYSWSYAHFHVDIEEGRITFQEIDHRNVVILFDIKKKRFIVQSRPSEVHAETLTPCQYFDDLTDTQIEQCRHYMVEEYKRMELKMVSGKAYSEEATRVHNMDEFVNDPEGETSIFSLEHFQHRHDKRVPFYVQDTELENTELRFGVYPVCYSALIYSIIHTWLHGMSQYLPSGVFNPDKEALFKCRFDPLIGAVTNTFVRTAYGRNKQLDQIALKSLESDQ